MKILSRVLFVLFVLIGVLIAVSNPQSVQLALWPLPHQVVMPVYLLVLGLLLLGVVAGLGLGWWGNRHHRRRARSASSEVARLEREVQRLRQVTQASTPLPSAGSGSPGQPAGQPHGQPQKALERQSALVTPQLASPKVRGPFS